MYNSIIKVKKMICDKIKINGMNINYVKYGKGNITMVLLHGWGQNVKMMMPVGNAFKSMFTIVIIDLPGFGDSDEPTSVLSIADYADVVHEVLKKLSVDDVILVGHSFGGRVSIEYASRYKVRKLILFASPFEKRIKKPNFKQKILGILKRVPILNRLEPWAKNHFGSIDYRNASYMMKKILVNTVNTDLTNSASLIDVPTLIIQGDNDSSVSLEEASRLNKVIKDSGLVVYNNKSHYAYLEDINKTISVMDKFLYKESRENNEN